MLVSDLVEVCFRQIVRNRARYQGVITIIALGIAGFIVVATLGESVELAVGRNLEILGRACLIQAEWNSRGTVENGQHRFGVRDLKKLRQLPLPVYVTPFMRKTSQQFLSEDKQIYGRLLGVESHFFDSLDIRLARGREISEADVAKKSPVCVIGSTILAELFPGDRSGLNRTLRTEGLSLKVVGVMGGIEDRSLARSVILPISVALTQLSGVTGFNGLFIRAGHWDDVEKLKDQVSIILRIAHTGYADYIEVESFPHKIKAIKKAVFLLQTLLVIALITVFVLGGVGIMNIMLAAVQESTRDIGLRKAVGATERWIMIQFLLQTIAISGSGAMLGVIVGTLIVEILKRLLHIVPDYGILMVSIVGGLIFGVALGASAGLFPARKASKLNSAQAMRFE